MPALLALLVAPTRAVQLGDLPGEDVTGSETIQAPPPVKTNAPQSTRGTNWLSPSVEEQLARDRTLIPLGKGAVFVPTYSEPRREPEVAVYNADGRLIKGGQTGERILLDSGTYTLRFGSGTMSQQNETQVTIEEGHTTLIPPTWGSLIVETLTADEEYIDGQYEVIRMDRWINYGKGHGLKEERLQDIKAWLLPPGLYRISKPGEGFASLRNYITVQVNAGELSQVELIYDKPTNGDVIAGGIKTLNARVKVGSDWTFGARVGAYANISRETNNADVRKEATQVSSDVRLRAIFDNVLFLGTNELFFQDNFTKEQGHPFSSTSDNAEVRTNWIRRLTPWFGPYIRGSVDTHIFPKKDTRDTIYYMVDNVLIQDTSRSFVTSPAFDPLIFAEGVGVNVDLISKYYLEAIAQVGIAGRQNISPHSYTAQDELTYVRTPSSYEIGAENTLNATLRIGSQVTLDLRTEIFAPNADYANFRLDDLTADFRFFLSRNVEVGYVYQVLEERLATAKNRFPSSHNLSLRLTFNY